jgi:hypothetical protein
VQAFDSISWGFINKVLDYYNFGPSFKNWIKPFQYGSETNMRLAKWLSVTLFSNHKGVVDKGTQYHRTFHFVCRHSRKNDKKQP